MLLAEINKMDPEEEKDILIENLRASNRELAHQLASARDTIRKLSKDYSDLVDKLLERVNIKP